MNNNINRKFKYFLLTGEPGVGKTTLTKNICNSLLEKGVRASGFYTEEVRRNRVRDGFDVITLDGVKGRLARDLKLLSSQPKFKVGKYGVLIEEFESIALPTLQIQDKDCKSFLVIDEIGKMEFCSGKFKSKIKEIFSNNFSNIVIATIPQMKSDPLIEVIRNHSEAKLWVITRENRNDVHCDIVEEIFNSIL